MNEEKLNMKEYLLFVFCSILFIISVFTNGYAQSASATWALTADTAVTVMGNVAAPGQVLSTTPIATDTLTVKDFLGGAMASPAERLWLDGTSWLIESDQNAGRYIQFSISPLVGNSLTVQSVSLNVGCFGTSYMSSSVCYSTDSTFSMSTQLVSIAVLPDIRNVAMTALNYNIPSIVINSDQKFYLRVYPWMTHSPGTTKYVCLTNVIISGTTTIPGSPIISAYPDSLSFGSVHVSTSKDMIYTLSGMYLTPESGNISITAPGGFGVSTTNGPGYSSSINVPYTSGTLTDTTIYVRFSPDSISYYQRTIIHSGGGAAAQNISVTGTGVRSDTILGIFVSANGNDSNPGTYYEPFLTIQKAVSIAQAGDTIFVRGGTYSLNTPMSISKIGTSNHRYYLFAYKLERPVLDYSSMAYSSSNRGINLSGSYWHIKGFDIYKAGDNGMYISGSNNIVEFCALYENQDSGLQLSSGASNNRIINCDSYYNYDAPNSGGNADGFSPKLDVGTGNYFYGCRTWQNSDDGWDCYGAVASVTIENCWTFMNGYLKDGTDPGAAANGNGFKVGGNYTENDATLINCLSFGNKSKGFDQNHNRGSMTFSNCTGYNNVADNYAISEALNAGKTLTLANCVELGNRISIGTFAVLTTNSWQLFTVTAVDFVSIDTAGVRGPRKADGSLPDITFMHLAPGSQFIDAGTNVGIPFNGSAPDLGCFESDYVTGVDNENEVRIADFKLLQNYPNPFNPTTTIRFKVPHGGTQHVVSLRVYDILGREITTLVNEVKTAGAHTVQWNGKNSAGQKVGSGVYFYQLKGDAGFVSTKKMIVLD